jgi:hypothetical protein
MAIETIDNFGIFVGKNIDSRYGPYASVAEATGSINSIFRYKGLTVLITGSGQNLEYWFNPTVANEDLVLKTINASSFPFTGSAGVTGSIALTGSMFVSGAISASYGPNTVGFYGTASWAQNALTASYASSGGSVTEIIAGTNITISPPEGTGSVTINSSAAAGSGASVAATASFTNATVWNFTHNLSSRYVVIQALDNNHNQIIPENITLVDTSSATLTFPTPESGYAMATIGGTTASIALTSLSVLTNNGGKIYDLGNDLVIEPFNNLIISGNMIPGPPYTANTSSFNLGSPTAAWNHLYVANGSVVFITGSNTADLSYTGTHIAATKPFTGSFTGSLSGIGPSSFSGSITLTGSLNVTGSTIQTGNNTLIGNTILSGSIGISGSSTIQGTTTMSGSLNISGSTTQTGNNTLIGNTILSGSINISGSTTLSGSTNFSGTHLLSGSNTIIGNTVLSGSIEVSGSSNFHDSLFIVTGSTFIKGLTNISGSTDITGSFNVVDGDINIVSGSSFTRWGNKLFNYGQFSSTETQSGSADTAYAMKFDTTDFALNTRIVNGSRITVDNTGIYNLQFSTQLGNTANSTIDFDIWFAYTGSNIAHSNTNVTLNKVAGSNGRLVAAWNLAYPMVSGSYIEIMWSCNAATGQLQAAGTQTAPSRPAIPSVIATLTQIA